jgi:hypothetical protein
MENGKAGTAAGNRPKNLGGKWRRYRCWGIAGNGEGDFREGENVEGENVGGKCLLALWILADPSGSQIWGKCLATLERDGRETDKSLTFSISLLQRDTILNGKICKVTKLLEKQPTVDKWSCTEKVILRVT